MEFKMPDRRHDRKGSSTDSLRLFAASREEIETTVTCHRIFGLPLRAVVVELSP